MDASSFPYTPFFHSAADANAKSPAWLNNPIYYHNRGDSTFAGESAEYGDFIGLDDLFTERPEVEQGMEDIYKAWVDFGIDGFRIDTAKHVNIGSGSSSRRRCCRGRHRSARPTSSCSVRSSTPTRPSRASTPRRARCRRRSTSASSRTR